MSLGELGGYSTDMVHVLTFLRTFEYLQLHFYRKFSLNPALQFSLY